MIAASGTPCCHSSCARPFCAGCLLAGGYRDDLTHDLAAAAPADQPPMFDSDRAANAAMLRRVRTWRPDQSGVTEALRASLEHDADLGALLRDLGARNVHLRAQVAAQRRQRQRRAAALTGATHVH